VTLKALNAPQPGLLLLCVTPLNCGQVLQQRGDGDQARERVRHHLVTM
jgi:hypothetical protein